MNIRKVEEKSMTIHIKKTPDIHRKAEFDIHAQKYSDDKPSEEKRKEAKCSTRAEKEVRILTVDTLSKLHSDKKGSMTHTLVTSAEAEVSKAAAKQMDGGEEVHDAALLAYEVSRPFLSVTRKGTDAIKASMLEQKKKKYKIVSPIVECRNPSNQQEKGKDTPVSVKNGDETNPTENISIAFKRTQKGNSVEKADHSVKAEIRPDANAKTKMSGNGAQRTISQGATAEKRKHGDKEQEMRRRKMKSFREKQAKGHKQAGKKIAGYLSGKVKQFAGKAVTAVLGVLGGAVGLIAMVAIPVVLIVTVLYNSPFALFLPSLDPVDTVQSVTNVLVSDFIMEAETLANDHNGYDEGEIYYCDPDGNTVTEVPQKDIMCVYMVKYGVGDAASVMNDRGKRRLETVVEDMCLYTTTDRNEVRKDEKGKKYSVTILEVNVTLKDYQDMVDVYGFNQEKAELLETLMNQW